MLTRDELEQVDINQFLKDCVNKNNKSYRDLYTCLKQLDIPEEDKEYIQKYIKWREDSSFKSGIYRGQEAFKKQLWDMIKPEEE